MVGGMLSNYTDPSSFILKYFSSWFLSLNNQYISDFMLQKHTEIFGRILKHFQSFIMFR